MPYVEVDIDFDELDTDDLVYELVSRFKHLGGTKAIDGNARKELIVSLAPLIDKLGFSSLPFTEVKTLDDKIKAEIIAEMWHKYSAAEFERRLK